MGLLKQAKLVRGTKACIRGKVLTLLTVLIINDLSPYTTPYKFLKALTPLMANDLSPYIRQQSGTTRNIYGQWINSLYESAENPHPNDSSSPLPSPAVRGRMVRGCFETPDDWIGLGVAMKFPATYSPYLWIDTSSPVTGQRFYRSIQLQ